MVDTFNSALWCHPNDKIHLEAGDQYLRPQNDQNIQPPKTNDLIWHSMCKVAQIVDASPQKVQTVFGKTLTPLMRCFDRLVGKDRSLPSSAELLTTF